MVVYVCLGQRSEKPVEGGYRTVRDYQRNSKYKLPYPVYSQIIWQIRDYYRLKDMADAVIDEKPATDEGMPHGSPSADGLFNKVVRRMKYTDITDLIDQKLSEIPKEYQRGVWNNILYRTAFPLDAARSTYALYKSKMIYSIAEAEGLI